MAKPSTEVANVVRDAVAVFRAYHSRGLEQYEVWTWEPTPDTTVTLRGWTPLSGYSWAIYQGPLGKWQSLLHKRSDAVRGTPQEIWQRS